MIRAVIIGFSHMHVNEVALYITEQNAFELVGAADEGSDTEKIPALRYTPEWNRENIRQNYCGNIYADYKIMLDELKPEMAFILSENRSKLDIVRECAKRGVNICIEKPMAMDYSEACIIGDTVKQYGIKAVVNWPVIWRGYIHKMKAVLDSGVVGTPIKLNYLNGHTGPLGKGAKHRGVSDNAEEMTDAQRGKTWWHKADCGGGIFADISGYGCLFARWMLGSKASAAMAYGANLNTPFGDTEDNFAAILKYDGKMAVIEGTWTTPRVVIPSGPSIVCTDGVIVCTGGAENAPDVKAYDIYGTELEIPELILSEKFKNMPSHIAYCLDHNEPIHEMLTLEANIELMAMIDAVAKSSASGKEEKVCG